MEFGTTIWALDVTGLVTVSGLFSVDRVGNDVSLQDYLHHEFMLLVLTPIQD